METRSLRCIEASKRVMSSNIPVSVPAPELKVGALTGADVTLLAAELSEETPEPDVETERVALLGGALADTEPVGPAEPEENETETDAADDDNTSDELRAVLTAAEESTLEDIAATTVITKRL